MALDAREEAVLVGGCVVRDTQWVTYGREEVILVAGYVVRGLTEFLLMFCVSNARNFHLIDKFSALAGRCINIIHEQMA